MAVGSPLRQAAYTTAVAQPGFNLDPMACPFSVGIGISIGTATTTFALQVALDDPFTVADADAHWFTVSGAPTNASGFVAMTVPVSRVRMNFSALTGGTVLFQVVQGVS